MKKIIAYAVREDERKAFTKYSKELNLEITYVTEGLSIKNVELAKGFEAVSVLLHCDVSEDVLLKLSEYKVKYLGTRSAGYNNVDMDVAKKQGIKISNATYSPNSVSEFTVMLALMVNRKVIESLKRRESHDYSVIGMQGRELHNQTVGIIGTGRIGRETIKNFSGFGCKIVAYDPYQNEEIKKYVEYVSLEELIKTSDIISLHAPLIEENYNLINKKNIDKMKDGVIIINTSRGELVNTDDLIAGLKSGKVFGAGLDVLEGEVGIYHTDKRFVQVDNDDMAILKSLNNVVLTNHLSFYTDQAVSDMVEIGLNSLASFMDNGESDFEVS